MADTVSDGLSAVGADAEVEIGTPDTTERAVSCALSVRIANWGEAYAPTPINTPTTSRITPSFDINPVPSLDR